jgi:hypothetical protein
MSILNREYGATIRYNVKIIKLILNSGANISAENMFYWTALEVVDPSNCLKLGKAIGGSRRQS